MVLTASIARLVARQLVLIRWLGTDTANIDIADDALALIGEVVPKIDPAIVLHQKVKHIAAFQIQVDVCSVLDARVNDGDALLVHKDQDPIARPVVESEGSTCGCQGILAIQNEAGLLKHLFKGLGRANRRVLGGKSIEEGKIRLHVDRVC
jgi:hypothetical protein